MMFGEKVHGQLSRKAEALSLPGLCSECPKRARFESPKAAERIAIKMGVVTEQPIHRWLRVAVKSRIRQRLKREVLLASVTLSRPVRPVNRAILSQVCF